MEYFIYMKNLLPTYRLYKSVNDYYRRYIGKHNMDHLANMAGYCLDIPCTNYSHRGKWKDDKIHWITIIK